MDKDMKLVNIYIKIHNKKTLTVDDLRYLAQYNPECFQKTCDNLVYNMPESKPLVKGDAVPKKQEIMPIDLSSKSLPAVVNSFDVSAYERYEREQFISGFLQNLRKMENSEVNVVQNVDLEEVKDLVGNLFMELMFPHNGVPGYFEMYESEETPSFNRLV